MQNRQIHASGNEYLFSSGLQEEVRRWTTLPAQDLKQFKAHLSMGLIVINTPLMCAV